MKAPKAKAGQRFVGRVSVGRPISVKKDHPERSRFMKPGGVGTVRPVWAERTALKSGQHSSKIGGKLKKSRWSGQYVFTLTLEERATCPRSCSHWLNCYGNHMPWAHRIKHGKELEDQLEKELRDLQNRYPGGFVVRLHILGDFYSLHYVRLWEAWLTTFPALNVYGYTAWQRGTPIGDEIVRIREACWDRFAVRTSDSGESECGTANAAGMLDLENTEKGIVCPMQTKQTESCATCGLCWQTKKNVVFLDH